MGAGSSGMPTGIPKQSGTDKTLGRVGAGLNMAGMIPGPQQPFVLAAAQIPGLLKLFGI